MRVNGYKLAFRLRELQDQREILTAQFNDSLFQFEAEIGAKPAPEALMRACMECERKIAALQVAQARYNLAVRVDVLGQPMTLHEAVKLVGGVARAARLWKDAAKKTDRNPYGLSDVSRDRDHEYARRMVSVQDCLEHATRESRWAAALRQAIQLGNSTELDLEGLDPELLE